MNPPLKKRILFICTHNSARSQMAEGMMKALYSDRYEAHSAGTEPSRVNPFAVRVMSELGIDISGHRSKSVQEFQDQKFDYVITVCDHAKETCPFFPGGKEILHKSFEDPAAAKGNDETKLSVFRRIRDEIRDWVDKEFGGTMTKKP
ncbi:MAG: arsenate reductase ArsC [Candidatus Aminicenantes bacterium]|nr:arsenate reductase ArsC [Candidatus Aminicenantes bacterium]